MELDLSRFEDDLAPVTLPNGRKAPVREFTPGMVKLYNRMTAGDEAAEVDLLRKVIPSLTDEELDDLGTRARVKIIGYASGRFAEVTAYLKNAEAAAPAVEPDLPPDAAPDVKPNRRRRSSQTTATSTP
jgi:hypothetical protein